jgi:hypothetical protein
MTPLTRATFRTSRLLDFCSERELVKQIRHSVDHWPLVIFTEDRSPPGAFFGKARQPDHGELAGFLGPGGPLTAVTQ